MIEFCKIKEKYCIFWTPPPPTKAETGAPIPTISFLVHYDNIMKYPAKFEHCSTI